MKELMAMKHKQRSKIQKLLISLSTKENEITEYQENVSYIKQHASKLQTFLVVKQIEKYIPVKEKY